MFKLSKAKTYLVVLVILNLLVVGFYLFFLNSIKGRMLETALLREELNLEVLKEDRLKSTKGLALETESQRESLDRYLIGKDSIVDFIKEVEGLGALSGVDLEVNSVGVEGFEIVDGTENKTIELLNLDLSTEGSWRETFYLVSLLESLPYKVSFNRLFLNKDSGFEGGSLWNGTIGLSVLKIK